MNARIMVVKQSPILSRIDIAESEANELIQSVMDVFDCNRLKRDIDLLREKRELLPNGNDKKITFAGIAHRTGCSRHSLRRWYLGLHQPRNPLPLVKIHLWSESLIQLESSIQKEGT